MQALGVRLPAGLTIWFALPVPGVVYDFRTTGTVYPVCWTGIVGMIIAVLRIQFSATETETWIGIAHPIVEALA